VTIQIRAAQGKWCEHAMIDNIGILKLCLLSGKLHDYRGPSIMALQVTEYTEEWEYELFPLR
jgi:hypothetical protein